MSVDSPFSDEMPPEQYSRTQTLGVRSAMTAALRRRLETAEFPDLEGSSQIFNSVFDSWPSYEDEYVPPAACVLPGVITYDSSQLTPSLVEGTWEPRGQPGLGLYKVAEISALLEIVVRCATDYERDVVVSAVEQLFLSDRLLMAADGARYGVVLPMPEYYGIDAEFSLRSARMLDNEDNAMREHRETVFTVSGRASQVVLGPVRPMKLTVRLNPDITSTEDC